MAQTAALGDTVVLYAGGSIDADGNLLSPSWQFVSVPAGSLTALSDPVAVRPSFVIDVAGDYVVELVVNDGTVNSAPDTVTISTVNSAPVAQAGRDRAISVGNTVHLDGSASSDFDGDRLGYSWTLTSKPAASTGPTLSDPSTLFPTFVADLAGTYVAQLMVKDGTEWSRPDTTIVRTGNVAPVADAGPDQTLGGSPVTAFLDGSGSFDDDLDTLAYDWALTDQPANSNAVITDAALTQTVMAYADANCPGSVPSVTRALGLAEETTTTLAYDPATCNLTSMIDPLGNPSSLAYDSAGNVISATDALLRESRFVYDGLNRMTKSIDATNSDPAPACGVAGVTCFACDAGA